MMQSYEINSPDEGKPGFRMATIENKIINAKWVIRLIRGVFQDWGDGYTDVLEDGAQRKLTEYESGWWEVHNCSTGERELRFKYKVTIIVDDE